ncbi:hypothetical protein HYX17_02640 [Candidatus Woesearchaeota archaeon]|nr:hypothetical protein [Candidatus Woesearchaeota archaeon]
MDTIRVAFDLFYDLIKPVVFKLTDKDPQTAHELFIKFCKLIHRFGLEELILDNKRNNSILPFELSNAAGFNKNGDIPPTVLNFLGFERVVVGTVTYDRWDGNPRPTIRRYPETESMVNWMGLPGVGAKEVAQRLASYGNHGVPITINIMSTPGKQGNELLRDLEGTILSTRNLNYVNRFELNVSCPNTHGKSGEMDARDENLRMLDYMLKVMDKCLHHYQEAYFKVSPDSTSADIDDTINVAKEHNIRGVVIGNTTTQHNKKYIPISPMINGKQVGGASGNAVYTNSLKVQKAYDKKIKDIGKDWKLIVCGGINSLERLSDRLMYGANGIQIYTPLVFSGPKLLRELRGYKK